MVVPRLDRLARDLLIQEVLLRDVRKRGADLVSCSPSESEYLRDDPEDPTRKLIRQVLGAVSEFERALISLRLRRGRAHKASLGGYAYGSPAFGWRAQDGTLVPVPQEQAALDLMRRLRGQAQSLREICSALTMAGHAPKRSSRWHPQTVATILGRADAVSALAG